MQSYPTQDVESYPVRMPGRAHSFSLAKISCKFFGIFFFILKPRYCLDMRHWKIFISVLLIIFSWDKLWKHRCYKKLSSILIINLGPPGTRSYIIYRISTCKLHVNIFGVPFRAKNQI